MDFLNPLDNLQTVGIVPNLQPTQNMTQPNENKPTDNLWESTNKATHDRLTNRVRVGLNAAIDSLESLEALRVQLDSAISQAQAARDTLKDADFYLSVYDYEQVDPRCADAKGFLLSAYLGLSVLGSLKSKVSIPNDQAYRPNA